MTSKKTNKKPDASRFIVDQSYVSALEEVSDIPISTTRKLKKNVYFRVKGGEGYDPLTLITLPDPRSMEQAAYIVDPAVDLSEIADQLVTTWCFLIITRSGEKKIFLTPAITELNKNLQVLVNRVKILEQAKTLWLRMFWDNELRLHRAAFPKIELSEPEWGEDLPTLPELIYEAFDGRVIESASHELVQHLLGGR